MENDRLLTNAYIKLENTYIDLPDIFYSKQYPNKVPLPELIIFNDSLAQSLGMDKDFLKSSNGIGILSGNKILEGTTPIAQAYAGHQFGYFTMLGDGRAVLLGEYVSEKGNRFDIQLKGSGRTPYSRGGDGKAALGPMLREYIISEAMNNLEIKTTRSLAVTSTGEYIVRESPLTGAVLTRLASSHLRVGTFEYAANFGTVDDVKALADYTLKRHFKKCDYKDNPYLYLIKQVIKGQADLISKWQLVGFIHGVMNTDNMSICGETIDYGPCAFMDIYNPDTVFSSIDVNGRYSYKNQSKMGLWNLARFLETMLPFLHNNVDKAVKIAEDALSEYNDLYYFNWLNGMRKKLGLFYNEDDDVVLVKKLLNIMYIEKEDFTNTFYYLTTDNIGKVKMSKTIEFKEWYNLWQERLKRENKSGDDIKKLMESNNPWIIPRNHRVEEALKAADNKDYTVMDSLLCATSYPYDYKKVNELYMNFPDPSSCAYKTYCGT